MRSVARMMVSGRGMVVVMVVAVCRGGVVVRRRSALEGVQQARPGGERGGDVATFQDVETRVIAARVGTVSHGSSPV
jgi:hypothetical protein